MFVTQPDNCQLCIHSQVCGIKQAVQSMKDTIKLNIPINKSIEDYMEIIIKCKHYQFYSYNWTNASGITTLTTDANILNLNKTGSNSLSIETSELYSINTDSTETLYKAKE